MKLRFTQSFLALYADLPPDIKRPIDKQLRLLLENPKHPSLRLHKMQGHERWEISVTMRYRITFSIAGDEYILRNVGPHDILKN